MLETGISGCYEIISSSFSDARGELTVTLNVPLLREMGLSSNFCYDYYSVSRPGVLRGFHFQAPPCAQTKLVYCISGEVLDAVLDVRKDSPTYGKVVFIRLSPNLKNMVYIPEGLAHAFMATGKSDSILFYHTSHPYSPTHEGGILWNSVDASWPVDNPVLSERDSLFPEFGVFDTPFRLATAHDQK